MGTINVTKGGTGKTYAVTEAVLTSAKTEQGLLALLSLKATA